HPPLPLRRPSPLRRTPVGAPHAVHLGATRSPPRRRLRRLPSSSGLGRWRYPLPPMDNLVGFATRVNGTTRAVTHSVDQTRWQCGVAWDYLSEAFPAVHPWSPL